MSTEINSEPIMAQEAKKSELKEQNGEHTSEQEKKVDEGGAGDAKINSNDSKKSLESKDSKESENAKKGKTDIKPSPKKTNEEKTLDKTSSKKSTEEKSSSKEKEEKSPSKKREDKSPKKAKDTKKETKSPAKTSTSDQEKDEEEEDMEEEEEEEEPKLGTLEQPAVIEGGRKRERKKIERLEMNVVKSPTDKKKIEIPEGSGDLFGDIPRIELKINRLKADDLKPLHRVLYSKVGSANEVKKNLRKFKGFSFSVDSPEYEKKAAILTKSTIAMLKSFCDVLDLSGTGTKESIVNRMMEFLLNPKSSGKALPKSKRRKSATTGTKRKRGEGKKEKGSPKKKKAKSKENVESNSEDEDEEEQEESGSEEEEKEEKAVAEASESEKSSEEEAPKKKKAKIEKKTPAKKTKPKKKATPKKKAASSDSSSDDSDDEPLAKSVKKPPTDDELKDVIKKILEGANLEEVTMKTVCKSVYSKFPTFDLQDRKDFIKSTVKQIIK